MWWALWLKNGFTGLNSKVKDTEKVTWRSVNQNIESDGFGWFVTLIMT